jgi:hypothetical protein
MTVSTTVRKAGPFAGTGLVSTFPFSFKVFSSADVLVVRTPAGGADVELTLTVDYTVSLNSDQDVAPGGSVTLTAALASGYNLSIGSQVDSLQGLSLTNNGGFYPKALEAALDKLDIQGQQQDETLSRALRMPFGTGAVVDLPAPVADATLVWNGAGTAIVNRPVTPAGSTFANLVTFDWAQLPAAINRVDWGIQTAANAYNALRQVTPSQWAAILNYTSTDDHTAAIQAAINSFGGASSTAQGTVYLPAGLWNLKTAGLVLPFEVSVRGQGGRATRIKVWGDWDAFSWSATIPSFSRQVSITDLWIVGPGYGTVSSTPVLMATAYTDSSAGTNLAAIAAAHPGIVAYTTSSGININHPFGLEYLNLNRLWIEEFPTYGIKTSQAGGSSVICFQFGDWSSIYLRYCNVGMLFGIGFTGESTFTNICSQFHLTSCTDISINGALIGAQGLNFNGLIGGWSPNGVRVLAGTAGNLKFDMLHMEHCTTAGFYTNSGSITKIVLESPWLAACAKAFLGDAGGHVCINNGTWQGAGSTTDNFIKLNAASNFTILLSGQHTIVAPNTGSAPTDHVSTTDIGTIKGFIQRKSATTGTINSNVLETLFLQTRGIVSETSTVFANNLGGNTTIGNGVSSVAVTFLRAESDTNYRIIATVDWGTATGTTWMPSLSIGSKSTAGFTAYFGTAAPVGGSILDWMLVR